MTTSFSFRPLFGPEGRLAIVCDDEELRPFDTEAILCLDDSLQKLIPSAPCVPCEFEGETAFVTCGYYMRHILLDHAKFFDPTVLSSSWSRTGIKPEVWARMLRLAQSNGFSSSKDLKGTLRGLASAFSGLDSSTELVITLEDIEVFEPVPDDTSWLPQSGWMELQTFDDFVDPTTGSVAPLGWISASCGPHLDVESRQADISLFFTISQVWAKVLKLEILSDHSVTARFAAEGVKSYTWDIGFSVDWKPTENRVLEFDRWIRYVIDQSLLPLRRRFRSYILFEELLYPQLATLASKATDNDQLWSSVQQLLDAFFPSEEISISSCAKLEFTLANPDLLLFTNSPEHCAKGLPEWVQYLLHQRTEARTLAKTHRHVDTSGEVTITSSVDHAEFHLTEPFLKFVSDIRQVCDTPDVTPLAVRVAVMTSGLPMLTQWICGYPVVLTGHAIYKELAPYKLPGGKTLIRDLSELIGEAIGNFCDLDMPLKSVVKYQFPVKALTLMLTGEVFNLDAVLDDFSWHMSKSVPVNTSESDLYLDRDRLELISKLFSPIFELFGCGGDEEDMSFASTVNMLRSRLFTLKPLASSYDSKVYTAFIRGEPYGAIPWFKNCLLLGIQNIGRRLRTKSPSALLGKCFVPAYHTQVREVFTLAGETVSAELQKWMIIGECASAWSLCLL